MPLQGKTFWAETSSKRGVALRPLRIVRSRFDLESGDKVPKDRGLSAADTSSFGFESAIDGLNYIALSFLSTVNL
ncbi:hypothetical protein TorRG33x02_265480 [Trema orientale]|uniref:Uncharacterized protein n=1 Tax=Trema orientale TaxID=63057 RepID=A0A2P5D1L9_TREOI|nr:hypothetical protein TorRG33x02_265480 [Trema orientale]